MTKNPIINATCAWTYIMLIVGLMNYIGQTLGSKPDSALAPMVFLSLLTLSVSVMAYVFFNKPLMLIIDGKKKEGITLFAQTIGVFGIITALSLLLLFAGII